MSLFDQQNGTEADYLNGPGFTDQNVHPSTFGGLSPLTVPKGVLAGADEGLGILAGGIPSMLHHVLESGAYMGAAEQGSDSDEAVQGVKQAEQPWMPKAQEIADTFDQEARSQAKELMPDPKTSGTGTNLVFGFAKTATEALGAAATRNPALAAPLFGYLEGVGSYRDLRDQGVDDATAQKSAVLSGALAAASFLAPMGVPAKYLDEMAPATQAVTQLATGAAVNTASGMAGRYATSKILEDAGYHDLAEQSQVLDGQSLLADILSGAFFGGIHYLSGRAETLSNIATRAAEAGNLDPSIRDAAKVAQDARAAAIDRAPGIPVDGESAGAHRAALEKALSDVLSDKPVDVSHELDDSDQFIPRPEDPVMTQDSRDLIHEEFKSAGVMGEASKVDSLEFHLEKMYRGESVPPFEGEVRIPTDVPRETQQADTPDVLAGTVPADDAMQNLKESQATDEGPKMIDLAAKCAGMTR